MKKLQSMILLIFELTVIVLCIGIYSKEVYASGENIGKFGYEINEDGDTITLDKYYGEDTDVIVPDEIDGYMVTGISWAFEMNENLTSVVLPEGLKTIGFQAFMDCKNLKQITIPKNVESIGVNAFDSCESMTDIYVDEDNAMYSSLDGILYNKEQTKLIKIPCGKNIEYNMPLSVSVIEESAFSHSMVKAVNISTKVSYIDEYTFYGCNELTEIELNVYQIRRAAFRNCKNLKKVILSSDVKSIQYCAFEGCASLEDIVLPSDIQSIENGAFCDCGSLKNIEIDDANENYTSKDGVLFNSDRSELIQYPGGKEGKYVIPNTVTEMEELAFYGAKGLTSVQISSGISKIPNNEFSQCSNLVSVFIPEGITDIGGWSFNDCVKLSDIVLPVSVKKIGEGAFYNCSSLTQFVIPNKVEKIEYYAFYGCKSLTTIDIPASVKQIGLEISCDGLFYDCDKLVSINVDENNENYTSVDGVLFTKDKTRLIIYPEGKTAEEYTIPDGVFAIHQVAFYNCVNLKKINIPTSVTSIGTRAFWKCNSLVNFEIPSGVQNISNRVFMECEKLESVIIPKSVTEIDENLLEGCSDSVIVYCYSGSVAEKYAIDNNLNYKLIVEEKDESTGDSDIKTDDIPDKDDKTEIKDEPEKKIDTQDNKKEDFANGQNQQQEQTSVTEQQDTNTSVDETSADNVTTFNIKNKKTYKKSKKVIVKDKDGIKSIKINGKTIKVKSRKKSISFKLSKYKKYFKKKDKWNKLVVTDVNGNKKTIQFKVK